MVRLTISDLEETVSIMVKTHQHQEHQAQPDKLQKPEWWPVDYQFPLKRRPDMNHVNWRGILHNLIAKCYQFNGSERVRTKRMKFRRNNQNSSESCRSATRRRLLKTGKREIVDDINKSGRMRRDSTGSSVGSTVSSLSGRVVSFKEDGSTCSVLSSRDSSGSLSDVSSAADVLANNLGLSKKPIVQVYDVCKIFDNNNIREKCDVKRDIHNEKNDFMSYFGLDTTSTGSAASVLPDDPSQTIKHSNRTNNIHNCPHVPFSSNIGLKLIKNFNSYEQDVVEKRLERLERYLCNNDLPTLLSPITEDFKTQNNKNSRGGCDHFYIFPRKHRHRDKLTPKAKFLLKKCKPCFVNLSETGAEIKSFYERKKPKLIAIIDLTNCDQTKQKENQTPLESRVVLTTIEKFKSSALANRSNFALQTLTPRNENLCDSMKKNINPSVVLQPIHELFEFSRGKIRHHNHKIVRTPPPYKIMKNRVNVYNPRRFSTRLQDLSE